MPSHETAKPALSEDVGISAADLIKGAFGLAAAKGAVQMYPNGAEEENEDFDENGLYAPFLPESTDSSTDLQVPLTRFKDFPSAAECVCFSSVS